MTRLSLLCLASCASAAVIVAHSDLAQTGSFTDTTLTVSNVNASLFGKKWQYSIDAPLFAQPIAIPGVSTGGGTHDLLIVATMTNKVYAFDANASGPALWRTSLGLTRQSFITQGISNLTVLTDVGVMSTPAADTSSNSLFVVGALPASWRLFQLSLSTGAILGQTDITGQVTGTGTVGDTVIAGKLQFKPALHFQRPGLTIANGKIYIAFGSIADNPPWHGWLFAYNESDLSQAAVFCATPSTNGGAIWQSGGAPAIDGSGNVYVTTGNNNSVSDGVEFGESLIKLSPTLAVLDYFTPSTFASLDTADADVSSNRVILIPGSSPLKAIISGKDFTNYIVDTTCMGHVQGSSACSLQTFKTNGASTVNADSGAYGMAFDNSTLFVPTTAGSLYAFNWVGSTFSVSVPLSQAISYGFPGHAQMSGANGILWTVSSTASSDKKPGAGTLRAIRESDFTELWTSDTTAGDTLGHLAKFVAPLIYNGRVYVPNQDGQIQVYGLR